MSCNFDVYSFLHHRHQLYEQYAFNYGTNKNMWTNFKYAFSKTLLCLKNLILKRVRVFLHFCFLVPSLCNCNVSGHGDEINNIQCVGCALTFDWSVSTRLYFRGTKCQSGPILSVTVKTWRFCFRKTKAIETPFLPCFSTLKWKEWKGTFRLFSQTNHSQTMKK